MRLSSFSRSTKSNGEILSSTEAIASSEAQLRQLQLRRSVLVTFVRFDKSASRLMLPALRA